jgi:dienelactone hydrolase
LFWWYGVLEAARAGMKVQGVVSFHGGLGRDAARVNNVIKARVLVLMVQMIYMFLQLK